MYSAVNCAVSSIVKPSADRFFPKFRCKTPLVSLNLLAPSLALPPKVVSATELFISVC